MGAALKPEDLVWAQTEVFARKVARSLDGIREASGHGKVGVCFSGGKDSTVALHLVRQVVPDARSAFFDSGCELRSTYDLVDALGVEIIWPRYSILEMARYAGWWERAGAVDRGCPFNAKLVLIEEPAEGFVVRNGLRVEVTGLRAEESGARKKGAKARGMLYLGKDRTWRCDPLSWWTLQDVWAYIASRKLEYNASYDRMTEAGIEREHQRVSTLLGDRGSGVGRHSFLRRAEPARWAELVREFPGLARDS